MIETAMQRVMCQYISIDGNSTIAQFQNKSCYKEETIELLKLELDIHTLL